MAKYYEYKCKDCGYTVNANPKGKDMVMMGDIYSYLCPDCKEIVDVLYPYGEKPEKIVCPECGSENLMKRKPKTGKCPKCGGDMENTGTTLLVDYKITADIHMPAAK